MALLCHLIIQFIRPVFRFTEQQLNYHFQHERLNILHKEGMENVLQRHIYLYQRRYLQKHYLCSVQLSVLRETTMLIGLR